MQWDILHRHHFWTFHVSLRPGIRILSWQCEFKSATLVWCRYCLQISSKILSYLLTYFKAQTHSPFTFNFFRIFDIRKWQKKLSHVLFLDSNAAVYDSNSQFSWPLRIIDSNFDDTSTLSELHCIRQKIFENLLHSRFVTSQQFRGPLDKLKFHLKVLFLWIWLKQMDHFYHRILHPERFIVSDKRPVFYSCVVDIIIKFNFSVVYCPLNLIYNWVTILIFVRSQSQLFSRLLDYWNWIFKFLKHCNRQVTGDFLFRPSALNHRLKCNVF